MKVFKSIVLPIFIATIWISISEFLRNELLFKNYWIEHYDNLGITFPSEPLNGAIWGLWSLFLAIGIFIILRKFKFWETVFISWFMAFIFMWTVIGNLGVLPFNLLYFAIPLSIIEVIIATFIIKKLTK